MAHKPSRPQVRIQTDPSEVFDIPDSNLEPPERERLKEGQDGNAGSDNEKNVSVSSSDHSDEKPPAKGTIKLPKSLEWIPANSTWSRWKPVIRSALAAWIAVVIFAIPRTENLLGQVCSVVILWLLVS
jgi:hypothetical protein